MKAVKIKGIGSYVPEKILTNDDLSKIVDTTDEWIVTRTGMRERHIADEHETTSDMCYHAALKAIEDAKIYKSEIDIIIVGTVTPDMMFPSTAALVQAKLGIKNVPCFDYEAGCSGFQYGMEIAHSMLKTGRYKKALFICGDKLSCITDWEDRSTCVLFGDGAGALVLSAETEGNDTLVDSLIGADGEYGNILYLPAGGSAAPASEETVKNRQHYIHMAGKEVFKIAVRGMCDCSTTILERNNLSIDDIACIIPHQANMRIIEALADKLGVSLEKCIVTLDKYGNTSAASIPIALDYAYRHGKIKQGDLILSVSFGAGLTWGASLLRF